MCLAFGGGVWKGPTKSSNLVVFDRVFDVGCELPRKVISQNVCIQYILCL